MLGFFEHQRLVKKGWPFESFGAGAGTVSELVANPRIGPLAQGDHLPRVHHWSLGADLFRITWQQPAERWPHLPSSFIPHRTRAALDKPSKHFQRKQGRVLLHVRIFRFICGGVKLVLGHGDNRS
jgi:hypothetical protein